MNTKKHYLIPLSYLLEVKDIRNINLNAIGAEHIKNIYSLNVRKNIYGSLKDLEGTPNYDFINFPKDFGLTGEILFSNEQVYEYLMNFKTFMENEEFDLLTDDRPTSKL